MRTLLLTFAATLLCAGAYAADPELYCADLTYDGFTTRSYTFATRGDRTLVLEIDLPERGDAGGPRPFVVYVPGGSWRTCGIGAFRRQSAYLVSQGIAGVRIVYSLVGDGADFSAGLEELQAARDLVAANWGWIRCGSATSRRRPERRWRPTRRCRRQVAVFSWDTTGFTT